MPAYVGDGSSWASKPAHKRDFEWSKTTEPHKPRNQMILAEFPQIKKLFGHDPVTKYKIVFAVTLQVFALFLSIASVDHTLWLARYPMLTDCLCL